MDDIEAGILVEVSRLRHWLLSLIVPFADSVGIRQRAGTFIRWLGFGFRIMHSSDRVVESFCLNSDLREEP